ncbi:MAG TPA: polyribonucleotide nucleotidyltransferase [Rhabdochlamydiaceae bacterium]|nr:polyribonucleotide nucleotidyltransferase [Rhabdochlamydiaceae bacterium]
MTRKSITISVGGRDIVFETGQIARQANGAVLVRSGETILLCTACAAPSAAEDIDFFPLRVDYQEKFSSTGKTLGGFIKREGRPAEREILICRLIDRPLRPMFEDGYYNEVQILSYVFSYDGVHSPDPLAICGASAALAISDIPLIKPIGAVRVGLIENTFIVNPTVEEQKKSRLDLILAGTEDAILMIEGYCDFLTEEQILQAVEEGHEAIRVICQALAEWQQEIGKEKIRGTIRLPSKELIQEVDQLLGKQLHEAFRIKDKKEREDAIDKTSELLLSTLFPEDGESKHHKKDVMAAFKKVQAHHMRKMILEENKRADGRTCDQIRHIDIQLGLLPRTHGSALFTRGETQSLAVCTLGGETMAQRYEDLDGESSRRFYLQYSFPPFSVGEVGRMGTPGRREIGHGKLAERALTMSLPKQETFPYIIRLESNITESNGSSSMASVCGGCLALMEAGVPIRHPIAGIAMGLILEGDKYAILSDILGTEDALGDMDFKVTGDSHGITAFQLDIKIEGINRHIMQVALAQAKQGRLHILSKMLEICPKPKDMLSAHAPRIETMQVKPSKIGTIIGPAGKQIRAIIEETGVQIDINDSGLVSISATSNEAMEKAKAIIHNLTAEVEIGKTYQGRIVSIVPFGLFVEIYGKEGLCHISEISYERIANLQDRFKEGDILEVKVIDINDRGQIKLSHKVLLPAPQR